VTAARIGTAVAAFAAAAVGAGLGARRPRRRAATGPQARMRTPDHCQCGQELLTVGRGRHRVFWLAGAPADEPLLEQRCPNCGSALI